MTSRSRFRGRTTGHRSGPSGCSEGGRSLRTVFCGKFYRRGAARGSAGGVSPPVRKWRDGYVAFAGGMPGGGGARANGEPASFSDTWEGGPVGRPRAGFGRRAEGGLSAFDEGLLSRGVSFPGPVYGIGRQPISIIERGPAVSPNARSPPSRGLRITAAGGASAARDRDERFCIRPSGRFSVP